MPDTAIKEIQTLSILLFMKNKTITIGKEYNNLLMNDSTGILYSIYLDT